MLAQNLKGAIFLSLSETDKKNFEEIRNTPPTDRHKEWLFKKLNVTGLSYTGKYKDNGLTRVLVSIKIVIGIVIMIF